MHDIYRAQGCNMMSILRKRCMLGSGVYLHLKRCCWERRTASNCLSWVAAGLRGHIGNSWAWQGGQLGGLQIRNRTLRTASALREIIHTMGWPPCTCAGTEMQQLAKCSLDVLMGLKEIDKLQIGQGRRLNHPKHASAP